MAERHGVSRPVAVRQQLALSAYWFSLNFQGAALLTIVIPTALDQLAYGSHTLVLARLAVLGSVVAMLLPPISGAFSDRIKRRGGQRRPMLLWGTGVNIAGLLMISQAASLIWLAAGFLVAIFGQNLAASAYQAMMPDMVPRSQWGRASGYMGVASLLGTIAGLATAGIATLHMVYLAMALTALLGAVYSASVMIENGNGETAMPRARISNRRDFLIVFFARFAVMFGQTLLMTFVLYFFQDVMHAASPKGSTALIGGMALVGAVLSSILLGILSDRSDRPGIVFFAGLPMAIAAGGFALDPNQNLIWLFGVLYGLGYGAYLSVDWALALDAIPDLRNVARDLGVWGIASNLPAVLAPAVGGWLILHYASPAMGYRALFLLSGTVTLLGSFIVLGVRTRGARRHFLLRLLVALILRVYVSLQYRVEAWGRLPRRRGGTLVVANHAHDLEGMVVPQLLFWFSPLGRATYSAGSQRIFEPGFLATRTPGPLARVLAGASVAGIVSALGVRPIENMVRARPFLSLAYEVYGRHGNLKLGDVFTDEALASVKSGRDVRSLRLGDVWRPALLPFAQTMMAFSALREPYRREARSAVRPRVEAQLSVLEDILRGGGTLYLTPEGRYTDDGRLSRFRAAYDLLWPLSERVYIAATAYDPFLPGRMRMLLRFLPVRPVRDLRMALLAARPVTVSQVISKVLLDAEGPRLAQELEDASLDLLMRLPGTAFLSPDLAASPRSTVRRALSHMVRQGHIEEGERGFSVAACRTDPRFPNVPDMVSYQAVHFEETEQALQASALMDSPLGTSI
jgi:MFS family permease